MDHDWLLNELRCSIPHTPMVNFALGVWARSKKSTRKIFLPGYVHASKWKRLLYYIMKDRQVVAIKPCPMGHTTWRRFFCRVSKNSGTSLKVSKPWQFYPPMHERHPSRAAPSTQHQSCSNWSKMLFFIVFTFARSKNVFIVQTGLFNVDSLPALYYDMTTERQIFLQLLPIFDMIIFATWKY